MRRVRAEAHPGRAAGVEGADRPVHPRGAVDPAAGEDAELGLQDRAELVRLVPLGLEAEDADAVGDALRAEVGEALDVEERGR